MPEACAAFQKAWLHRSPGSLVRLQGPSRPLRCAAHRIDASTCGIGVVQRALLLIPGGVGGTEIYLRSLLLALDRLDTPHQFVVFINAESARPCVTAPRVLAIRGNQQHRRSGLEPSVASVRGSNSSCPAAVRRHQIDVLLNPSASPRRWWRPALPSRPSTISSTNAIRNTFAGSICRSGNYSFTPRRTAAAASSQFPMPPGRTSSPTTKSMGREST